MIFKKLAKRHLPLVDAFSCIESDEKLKKLNAKARRRVKRHSKEMDDFLREEAYQEQKSGMSVTFLLLDDDENEIYAYVSLCNDAIGLAIEERQTEGIAYSSAPALKIARLAVSSTCSGRGFGKKMIEYVAYRACQVRRHSGIFFITLDCYSHRVSFYESIGFKPNVSQTSSRKYDAPISMRISLDSYLERFK